MRAPHPAALLVAAAAACARPAAPSAPASTPSAPSVSDTTPAPGPTPPGSVPPPAATVPAAPPGAAPAFGGTRWVLVRVGDERVVTTTDDPRRVPHLVFDEASGRAAGSGGCNRIAGPFRRDGDALTVGPMAGTRMACPDGMATEQALLAALARVRAWRVAGARLELLDAAGADGRVVAAFLPAPAAPR